MGTLVEDLERPESYPPPPPAGVERVTTHASWVFLTDREAWKIKRPVDYGFLDFTTPEKRRHFCEEEVRLNRRLAPGVYLGVETVRRDARGHSLVRGGEAVDYAVRMRRLPDGASALALLRSGALGPEQLEALAARLALFYAGAQEAPGYGALEVVRANVEQNFAQVEPFVGRFVEPALFDEVRAWQRGFLASGAARFEERARGRRIREGHGDLRLEHVYFVGGDVLVIDCIEFNPAFRHCDAASDVAFLAMDLDHERRPDLSAWFLSRFALEAGDYDLYPVVDFYLGYRAWVRGKVACFVAADPSTPAGKRERKAEEARTFFAQALHRARARPSFEDPRVIAVGGIIGSGKTTLARALSLALGSPVVGSDATRKQLAGVPLTAQAPPEGYTPEFSRRTFVELFRRAGVVLGSGRGVILDATFGGREIRRQARDLAARHGRPFLFVETRCDAATARARLRERSRAPSISDAGENLYDRLRREFQPVDELPPAEHLLLDATLPVPALVERVRARLHSGA